MSIKEKDVVRNFIELCIEKDWRSIPIQLDDGKVTIIELICNFKKMELNEQMFIWKSYIDYEQRNHVKFYQAPRGHLVYRLSVEDIISIYNTIINSYDSIIFQCNL